MKIQMKFKPVPPLKNPETDKFCQDMAAKFIASGKKHGEHPAPEWWEEFNNWVSVRRLVYWEALAIKQRTVSLIRECEQ